MTSPSQAAREAAAREVLAESLMPSNTFDFPHDASRVRSGYDDVYCFLSPKQVIRAMLAFEATIRAEYEGVSGLQKLGQAFDADEGMQPSSQAILDSSTCKDSLQVGEVSGE